MGTTASAHNGKTAMQVSAIMTPISHCIDNFISNVYYGALAVQQMIRPVWTSYHFR